MGGALFCKVVAVAGLKKRELQKFDKMSRNYDRTPFTLDGQLHLDITFEGTTMHTPVYVKVDAPDQLLLSEGLCCQLGIIGYHPSVVQWRGGKQGGQHPPSVVKGAPNSVKQSSSEMIAVTQEAASTKGVSPDLREEPVKEELNASVPLIRVCLLQSVKLLPHQRKPVLVKVAAAEGVHCLLSIIRLTRPLALMWTMQFLRRVIRLAPS